ncbi:HAMP domain-containing protein [Massilia sp. CCM 8693]|uniref:histidine kinase n=2 Tax=Massilia aquatica TaxID=2609000 RepID=A0ABX0MEG4_9BURK|nr:HAMP domain-containing protein [Massilia aquatica]
MASRKSWRLSVEGWARGCCIAAILHHALSHLNHCRVEIWSSVDTPTSLAHSAQGRRAVHTKRKLPMKTEPFRLNIFHKLVMTLLAVSLIPLIGVWYAGSSQARSDATANISQHLIMTASGIATGITSWDEANVRALHQSARLEDIRSMEATRQTPILRALGETYEWAFLVFTIEPGGENIARSDDKPLTRFGERSYFQGALKGAPSSRQVLISKSTGRPALTIAVPIRNAMGGTVGVLAMAMKLDDISKVIKDTRIGETGYAILLDADNKVIASGRPDQATDAVQDMSSYPALKVDGIAEQPTVYEAGEKRMVGYARKLPQGWTLLVEQDYAEAYASLDRLETGARALIVLTAALVVGVAAFLAKQLTMPINQLIVVAEQLSKGEFAASIPGIARGDEIGSLARAIERLGISIQMAITRLSRRA